MTPAQTEETAARLRRQLAADLAEAGYLRSPQWRSAVEAVPRHEFVPQFLRLIEGTYPTQWEPISPGRSGAQRWLELAYADESLVTQLDGDLNPSQASKAVTGDPTSSATMPSLVLRMWEDLDVRDGDRVLEVGTGTGYSTALGSHRLGEDQITSVEVDPTVAQRAKAALARAGYHPRLVVGDGLAGHPAEAPYDRVIATCAFRHVPPAWLAQSKPGATILVTLTGWLHGSGLAKLTVTGPGTAEGSFLPGDVSFMIARAQAPTPVMVPVLDGAEANHRAAIVGPDVLSGTGLQRMLAQLAAPNAQYLQLSEDDGTVTHLLVDSDESFTTFTASPDGWLVTHGGPQPLWDKIEASLAAWEAAGKPALDAFRITITPDEQVVSAGDASLGTLPA